MPSRKSPPHQRRLAQHRPYARSLRHLLQSALRASSCLGLLLGMVTLAAVGQCWESTATPEAPQVRFTPTDLSLLNLSRDHVTLTLAARVEAPASAEVVDVRGIALTINQLPVFLKPRQLHLQLRKNQVVQLPKPLDLAIYLRDWASLASLQNALKTGQVKVHGTLLLRVRPGGLGKLFVGMASVPVSLDTAIPVVLPAWSKWLGPASDVADVAGNGAALLSSWSQKAMQLLPGSAAAPAPPAPVLFAASRTRIPSALGTREFWCTGVAVRVTQGEVLVPKDLVLPWRFDPSLGLALGPHANPATLDFNVWLWPQQAKVSELGRLDGKHAWQLRRGDLVLAKQGKATMKTVYVPKLEKGVKRLRLERQIEPGNWALLRFSHPPPLSVVPIVPLAPPGTLPPTAVLFRFPQGLQASMAQADRLELSLQPLTTQAGSHSPFPALQLAAPLDASAWGSPVLSPGGLIGVLIGQRAILDEADIIQQVGLQPAVPGKTSAPPKTPATGGR